MLPVRGFAKGEGLAGVCVRGWSAAYRPRALNDSHYIPFESEASSVHSAIAVPLIGQTETLGVLCLDNVQRTEAFDTESLQVLELFAGQLALCTSAFS